MPEWYKFTVTELGAQSDDTTVKAPLNMIEEIPSKPRFHAYDQYYFKQHDGSEFRCNIAVVHTPFMPSIHYAVFRTHPDGRFVFKKVLLKRPDIETCAKWLAEYQEAHHANE